MQILNVENKFDNKKICDYLLLKYPNLKQNTLFKALRKKDIRVNNVKISENVIIHSGDEIKIFIVDDLLENNYNKSKLDIIYQDDNILVVNKPAGIEVNGNNSLTSQCKKYLNSFVSPCHRLDRNTTGLVLFAKNQEALNILFQKFKNKEIEKYYRATVFGIPSKKQDRLLSYLFKDAKKSLVYISDTPKKGYQKIITNYKVIKENKENNTSVLDIKLETGKTHQIRAHLAHIGHPIIGDGKYGINQVNKKFNKKTQELTSYCIKFNFTSDSGILEYLNGMEFKI